MGTVMEKAQPRLTAICPDQKLITRLLIKPRFFQREDTFLSIVNYYKLYRKTKFIN